MAKGAKVQSVEMLGALRAALLKFAQSADTAMADAEGEMGRMLMWLENEQPARWRGELAKRSEALARAKEALRMKTLYKDSSGRAPSADEERKAVISATRRVEEAQAKIAAIRKWTQQLHKEAFNYQGSTQRLAGAVRAEIPKAAAVLSQASAKLEAYVNLASSTGPSPGEQESAGSSINRPLEDEQEAREQEEGGRS